MGIRHKRFCVFFFLLIVFMVSCSDRPSGVLKEKEMVDLLVDMQLAEAYTHTQNTLSNHEREDLGKRVLIAHGVSAETLDTTLAWYGRNMDEYSDLYEKVDKELQKRRKKYTENPADIYKEIDDLWPYSQHLVISPLSGHDSFTFSLLHPEIKKGEILQFSFYLPNSVGLRGTLGVEYEDGRGEATITNTTRNKVMVEVQTDSSKVVKRIFGTMHVKDLKKLPLYIDSISLKGEPIDTINYRSKRRSQKSFGPL